MKKVIIFLMIMLMPMVANAQRVDKPGEPYEVYCFADCAYGTLNCQPKLYFNERLLEVYLCDDNNTRIEFGCQSDFLNYLSKRGWVYIGNGTTSSSCILKKQVTNDNQITEHLNLKSLKESKKK